MLCLFIVSHFFRISERKWNIFKSFYVNVGISDIIENMEASNEVISINVSIFFRVDLGGSEIFRLPTSKNQI